MIPRTGTAFLSDHARAPVPRGAARILVAVVEAPRAARPAPRPQPRRLGDRLPGLLATGSPVPDPCPIRAAAQAFRAGDGYLPGQIIDRTI